MLAEYLAPLPTAMVCTIAVCTGSGRVSAAFCCLQARPPSVRAVASAVRQSLTAVGFIGSLFPKSLFKCSLCVPEGKQALFIIVVGVGDRGLLLQYIAQQYGGMFELIAHFAQLLIGRVAGGLGHIEHRTALLQLAEVVVDIEQHLGLRLLQLKMALLHTYVFLPYFISAPSPIEGVPFKLEPRGKNILRQNLGVDGFEIVDG